MPRYVPANAAFHMIHVPISYMVQWAHIPNDTSIGPAIFTELMVLSNRHKDQATSPAIS